MVNDTNEHRSSDDSRHNLHIQQEGVQPRALYSGASPAKIAADLAPLVDFQAEGMEMEEVVGLVERHLLPHLMNYDQPGFQSMFNAFPERGAEYGARVALTQNQGVTNWQVSPGGAVLEEMCCAALCRLFDLPSGADCTFMYCGTYANQQALYMALHKKAEQYGFDFAEKGLSGFDQPEKLAVATSCDAHFSVQHALRMLGIGEQGLVLFPVEDRHRRLDTNALRNALPEDRDLFCVIATAGTTSTGAVDPIRPLVTLCKETGAWLHVDGAYGFAYSLVPERRALFDGIEQADSISWDPHKQLGVPIPNSVLFVREKEQFERMALFSSYFNREREAEPNPGLKSPPSTRPFSALPLVTSLRFQGMKKVIQRLRTPIQAIQSLAEHLETNPDVELKHSPDTGILCFRFAPEGYSDLRIEQLQQYLFQNIQKTGERSIAKTRIDGKTVLRLVAISPTVTYDSLVESVSCLRVLASRFDDELPAAV